MVHLPRMEPELSIRIETTGVAELHLFLLLVSKRIDRIDNNLTETRGVE